MSQDITTKTKPSTDPGIGQWWISDCDESFHCSMIAATKEEAVLLGRQEWPDAERLFMGLGESRQLYIDADRIIDDISSDGEETFELYEDALSNWCDHGGKEWADAKDQLSQALTDEFHKWLEAHGEKHTFCTISVTHEWTPEGGIKPLNAR